MMRTVTILSLLLVALEARADKPGLPNAIALPEGYEKVASFEAKGDQIYKAAENKAGDLEWVLKAPKAVLYDAKGKKVGTHYAGPTWEAEDGSKLVRDSKTAVKVAPSNDPKANIPLLLIRVKSDGKNGTLSKVVYVHRLNTKGGVPKKAPSNLGSELFISYSATYVFYAKKE